MVSQRKPIEATARDIDTLARVRDILLVTSLCSLFACDYDWSDGTAASGASGSGGSGSTSVTGSTTSGPGGGGCDTAGLFASPNLATRCAAGDVCLQPNGCDLPGTCAPDTSPTPSGIVCTACANQAYPSAAAANADGLAVVAGTDCLPGSGDTAMRCGAETCNQIGGVAQCRHDVLASGMDTFTCVDVSSCATGADGACCNAGDCDPLPIPDDGTIPVFCLLTCPEK